MIIISPCVAKMSLNDYKLSCELNGHTNDVRSVVGTTDCIVSGSRDKTAIVWTAAGDTYSKSNTLSNHTNFVSAVCLINDNHWICTGSNDATICLYVTGQIVPFAVLKDHSLTVCCLSQGLTPKTLVSGSWDKTARVWTDLENGASSIVLEGHEASVWAVASLKNHQKYVTGSADKNIFVWNIKGEKLKVLKGHSDCVRGLVALDDGSLISCGNDAAIKYWNQDGECVKELDGHANYVYSISLNPYLGNDVLVSGGEDSSIRMWSISKGGLGDPIEFPAQSVWSVTCLPNGDIVTGTSDGIVRVFTREESRMASEALQFAFTSSVESRKAERNKELGGYKVNDLPGPESLLQVGTEGQTRIVRHPNGKIMCYQWTKNEWTLVGDVLGGSGGTQEASGRVLHNGKEYDYVFSVDIDENAAPLKLPYNIGQDPWMVAQKFIHENNLPQVYLDQVANFVVTNSGGRAMPGGGNLDPFTGDSSYSTINPAIVHTTVNEGTNVDAFTGGSSYSTAASKPVEYFPSNQYMTLDTCDPTKVLGKLRDFNAKIVDSERQVSDSVLEEVIKLTITAHIAGVSGLKTLLGWPKGFLFPVLDVLRLAVRHESVCKELGTSYVIALLIDNIESDPANQLMAIRSLANMMIHDLGKKTVEDEILNIVNQLSQFEKGSVNLQVAIATLYLNLSVAQTKTTVADVCKVMTEGLCKFLPCCNDIEAIYRATLALGNLSRTPTGPITIALINSLPYLVNIITHCSTDNHPPGFEKLNGCAQQLITALSNF